MAKAEIKGLTLYRPWGHAIALCGKDVENRSRPCLLPVGSFLAIHNGLKIDSYAEAIFQQFGLPMPTNDAPTMQAGHIIAIARFEGNFYEVGEERLESRWAFPGNIWWKLGAVVAIEPVPARGQQFLWNLPDSVLEQVRLNWRAAQQVCTVDDDGDW